MRTFFLTGAAALAVIAVPASAQDMQDQNDTMSQTGTSASEAYARSPEQQTMYDAWPADRRATYDAWPSSAQEYYWTLDDTQTQAWWILNDDQRVRIVGMTPEQRAAAWTSIAAQMNGAAAPAASATAAPQGTGGGKMDHSGMDHSGMQQGAMQQGTGMMQDQAGGTTSSMGQPQFVRGEVVQTTPADQQAASGEVPICSAGQQDNCMNAWEAGKRGKGVPKPLDYWPGRPASEMSGSTTEPQT